MQALGRPSTFPRTVLTLVAGISAAALSVSACSGSTSASPPPPSASGTAATSSSGTTSTPAVTSASPATTDSGALETPGDVGAKLTIWMRNATGAYTKALVDTYNSTHKNQVALTVIPDNNFVQKVGQAAGSHSLPDLLATDVVYSPNFVKQGVFADVTDKLKALPFFDKLGPAHIKAASADPSPNTGWVAGPCWRM